MQGAERGIAEHYTHGSLLAAITEALEASGVDPEKTSADDLAAVDEFHTGGRGATVDFADAMGVTTGMRLLDIGSGIGGPARFFAGHRGCTVAGVDLSAEFCETATALSERTGLGDRTEFKQGSAVSLHFADGSFDGAYMLHVGMNISAKGDLFREVSRVLKPGGVFGIFDMMREGDGDIQFPVPWAQGPEMSFVETPATYIELLRAAGFTVEKQRARRDFALAFFAKMREVVAAAKAAGSAPPIGLQLVMGPTAQVKVGNLFERIEKGVLAPVELVCRKV